MPEGTNSAGHSWSVRVRLMGQSEAKVYSGRHTFSASRQAGFGAEDPHPSSVEYLLGALGSDLVSGFRRQAQRLGVDVDSVEAVVSGSLESPLVFLDVVGAEGRPGFGSMKATVYVGSEAGEAALDEVWSATLARSPLVDTLKGSVALSLEMRRAP